jgi:membrane protein
MRFCRASVTVIMAAGLPVQSTVSYLVKDTLRRWSEHGDMLAAAIAFYTLLSLPAVLVLTVSMVSGFFDPVHARAHVIGTLRAMTSDDVADTMMGLMDAADESGGPVTTLLATVLLLWAAGRVFTQLQRALNLVWGVEVLLPGGARQAVRHLLYKRMLAFAMVLACGGLLLATLVLQGVLSAVGDGVLSAIARVIDTQAVAVALLSLQQTVLALALMACLFAIIYRVLPDARIHWADVWIGATLTSLLVLAGTWLLGATLSMLSPRWLQATLGSVAAFMLWAYYLAQVFLLGAAFTRAWAGRDGARIVPESYARLSIVP